MRVRNLTVLAALAFLLCGQSVQFPARIPSDQDLGVARDRAISSLTNAISSTTLTVPVANGAAFAEKQIIRINMERMQICTIVENTLTLCAGTRGMGGTTAAAHANGAVVEGTIAAYYHNALRLEVQAITAALGVNLAHPLNKGTTLPGTCAVGDVFYATDAAAGRNIYGCTAANTWTLQGDGASLHASTHVSGGSDALSGTLAVAISGNAATATALAANPTDCSGGQYATAIDAAGNLTCASPVAGGYVLGPATNTDNHIPQWQGTDSRTLRNGLAVASANTAGAIVLRDGGGGFSAGQMTGSLTGSPADVVTLGTASRFKLSDTATSYPALIGQGASTLVNHFLYPAAQAGRHYTFAAQMSGGTSGAGDKVAGYFAAESGTGTSDIWAGNFLTTHNSGAADVNIQTVEIDFNENNAHGTLHTGKLRSALSLTSGGSFQPGAHGALYINATNHATNRWIEGIHIDGVSHRGIDVHMTAPDILVGTTVSGSASPQVVVRRARGTPGAEAAVQFDNPLGAVTFQGHTGTAYESGAVIAAYASETWTGTAQGGYLQFITTKPGTAAKTATVIMPATAGIQLGNGVGAFSTPTCDATTRGTFFYQPGGAGVKDAVSVCAKDASNVYAWRVIY